MKIKSWFYSGIVFLLIAFPLLFVSKLNFQNEPFSGTDTQAISLIKEIQPQYKPLMESLFEPPGKEIESLFFALQAAAGAGFIGYWLGVMKTRYEHKAALKVKNNKHVH